MRFCAALAVFAGHSRFFLLPAMPKFFAAHASEAVAVFFVLSGFVIRFVTTEKELHWQQYVEARVSRMLSVVLLAIAVTFVADLVGRAVGPDFYVDKIWFNAHASIVEVLSYLTFTNELWFQHTVFGSNEPYWSLGFEVPYYVLFGLLIFLRGRPRLIAAALWALVVGPKIWLYLPLWMLGVVTYEVINRLRFDSAEPRRPRLIGLSLIAASVIGYLMFKFVLFHGVPSPFRVHSVAQVLISALYFSLVGGCAAVSIIGFDLASRGRDLWPDSVAKVVRWLAGGSFTLYLVHQPILAMLRAAFPRAVDSPLFGVALLLVALVGVYGLAELGERRKGFFQKIVRRVFSAAKARRAIRT